MGAGASCLLGVQLLPPHVCPEIPVLPCAWRFHRGVHGCRSRRQGPASAAGLRPPGERPCVAHLAHALRRRVPVLVIGCLGRAVTAHSLAPVGLGAHRLLEARAVGVLAASCTCQQVSSGVGTGGLVSGASCLHASPDAIYRPFGLVFTQFGSKEPQRDFGFRRVPAVQPVVADMPPHYMAPCTSRGRHVRGAPFGPRSGRFC